MSLGSKSGQNKFGSRRKKCGHPCLGIFGVFDSKTSVKSKIESSFKKWGPYQTSEKWSNCHSSEILKAAILLNELSLAK